VAPSEAVLIITLGLAVLIVVGYIPVCLFVYWLTRVRGGREDLAATNRLRDIPGFFTDVALPKWQGRTTVFTAALATVVICLGCLLVYPAVLGLLVSQGLIESPAVQGAATMIQGAARPLFFGFLGAYIFTLQYTLRRFLDSDLSPDAFVTVSTRMILSLIVAGMLGLVFPGSVSPQNSAGLDSTTLTYAAAFVVGIFPEDGLNWLISIVGRFVPMKTQRQDKQLPLQTLAGLTNWHAFRLTLEGIQNVQNLASADIDAIVRRTRFGVQQIFDWIDQAVLAIHLNDEATFHTLQRAGIRGFSDFQSMYLDDETRSALDYLLGSLPVRENVNLAENTQDAGSRRARLLYTAMREAPSVDQVRLYWQYKGTYATGVYEPFNRGRAYVELKSYAAAVQEFTTALQRNPMDVSLYIKRGEALEAQARETTLAGNVVAAEELSGRAITDFTRALRLDPLSSAAYFRRGGLYLRAERWADAIGDYSALLRISAHDVESLNQRAVARFKSAVGLDEAERPRLYRQALSDLQRAQTARKDHPQTYVLRARILIHMCRFEEAAKALTIASQIEPNGAEASYAQAELYVAQNQVTNARAEFLKSMNLGLTEPEHAWLEIGRIDMQRWQEFRDPAAIYDAMGAFKAAIDINASFQQAYVELANANRLSGDSAEAVALYRKVIDDLKVERANVYVNRGLAYMELNNFPAALNDLTRGIGLDPDGVAAYTNRAIIYERQGQLESALADFNRVVVLHEKLKAPAAAAYSNRGNVQLKLGRYDEAIADLERALTIEPRSLEALNNLGQVHYTLGQLGLAETYFTRALQLTPAGDGAVYFNRGLTRMALGQYADARSDFANGLKLNETHSGARLWLARAAMEQHDWPAATEALQRLMQTDPNNSEALREQSRLHVLMSVPAALAAP
jgi:tetratricopeptide (TPR) repeat protein